MHDKNCIGVTEGRQIWLWLNVRGNYSRSAFGKKDMNSRLNLFYTMQIPIFLKNIIFGMHNIGDSQNLSSRLNKISDDR